MYGYPTGQFNPNVPPQYAQNMGFNSGYQQPSMNQNFSKSQFLVRQVSNIEEAKSFIIDAFSTFLFVDYNNAKIYMKRMNNNGGSDFYTFSIMENQVQIDPLSEINKRLSNIESKLGGNNVQSISSNDAISSTINATKNDESNATAKSTSIPESSGNDAR